MTFISLEESKTMDFFSVCEKIMRKHNCKFEDMISKAVHEQASSFHVSRKTCNVIISDHLAGKEVRVKNEIKRKQYQEIIKRYINISKQEPKLSKY